MLNLGSGDTRLHPSIINLDVEVGPFVDIVGSADNVPLDELSVDPIISQEMLEHVPNPSDVMKEIYRILRPSGSLYLQVPWIIGYHGCPVIIGGSQWTALKPLLKTWFFCPGIAANGRPIYRFHRVTVEAFAILVRFSPIAYKPFKLIASVFFAISFWTCLQVNPSILIVWQAVFSLLLKSLVHYYDQYSYYFGWEKS